MIAVSADEPSRTMLGRCRVWRAGLANRQGFGPCGEPLVRVRAQTGVDDRDDILEDFCNPKFTGVQILTNKYRQIGSETTRFLLVRTDSYCFRVT